MVVLKLLNMYSTCSKMQRARSLAFQDQDSLLVKRQNDNHSPGMNQHESGKKIHENVRNFISYCDINLATETYILARAELMVLSRYDTLFFRNQITICKIQRLVCLLIFIQFEKLVLSKEINVTNLKNFLQMLQKSSFKYQSLFFFFHGRRHLDWCILDDTEK